MESPRPLAATYRSGIAKCMAVAVTDRICTNTDSDISDNHICVSFQFPTLRMEADRIRTDTDSDISDNHICVSFRFPSLRMETDRICTDMNSDISDIFGYPFSCFLTVSIPIQDLAYSRSTFGLTNND